MVWWSRVSAPGSVQLCFIYLISKKPLLLLEPFQLAWGIPNVYKPQPAKMYSNLIKHDLDNSSDQTHPSEPSSWHSLVPLPDTTWCLHPNIAWCCHPPSTAWCTPPDTALCPAPQDEPGVHTVISSCNLLFSEDAEKTNTKVVNITLEGTLRRPCHLPMMLQRKELSTERGGDLPKVGY